MLQIKASLYKKYFNIKKENIILSFEGEFSQNEIVAFGEKLTEKLLNFNVKKKIIKKVFAVFIELSQNILHYSDDKMNKDGCGIVVVSKSKNSYFVTSGNVVKKRWIDFLTERCFYLNSINGDMLKTHYKQVIRDGGKPKRVSGGVGLIDIRRKSQNPLQYQHVSIDQEFSFWMVTMKIDKEM